MTLETGPLGLVATSAVVDAVVTIVEVVVARPACVAVELVQPDTTVKRTTRTDFAATQPDPWYDGAAA